MKSNEQWRIIFVQVPSAYQVRRILWSKDEIQWPIDGIKWLFSVYNVHWRNIFNEMHSPIFLDELKLN